MTQHRALSAGENRCHETAVEAQTAVADGIDASVDPVQLATIDSIANSSRSQTSRFKLPPRNRSMLPRRNFRYLSIRRVDLLTHVGT